MDDEEIVRKQREKEAAAEKQRQNDFIAIMATPGGRRVVYQLLSECNVFMPIFDPSPAVMAWKEGARNVGLRYLDYCNTLCPNEYQTMINESHQGNDE